MRTETVTVVFDRKKRLEKTGIGKVDICVYLGRTERKYITIHSCTQQNWVKYQKSEELKMQIKMYQQVIERMKSNNEQMTIETFNNYTGVITNKKKEELEIKKMTISVDGFLDFMRTSIAKEKLARSTEKHKYGTIDALIRFSVREIAIFSIKMSEDGYILRAAFQRKRN